MRMHEKDYERGPATGNAAHFVSTRAEHLGFGHGSTACPGRLFISHKLKLASAEIISAYEFECAGGQGVSPPLSLATNWLASSELIMRVRRRNIPGLDKWKT